MDPSVVRNFPDTAKTRFPVNICPHLTVRSSPKVNRFQALSSPCGMRSKDETAVKHTCGRLVLCKLRIGSDTLILRSNLIDRADDHARTSLFITRHEKGTVSSSGTPHGPLRSFRQLI